ncbi:MAG TPA: hypothetical protein VGP98_10180, partial [Pyrinomonadaceae bacterium]|nr:hypothetical protein [Pyrinomonadaceae bacterium]
LDATLPAFTGDRISRYRCCAEKDVAISLLEDWGFTYNENFAGFEFIDFRGVHRTGIGKRK